MKEIRRHTNELRWLKKEEGKVSRLILQQKVLITTDKSARTEWINVPVTTEEDE